MDSTLKLALLAVIIASGMTIVGLPFGAIDETHGTPGTLGIDHHIWITFLHQKFIDLDHYGHPGGILNGYFYAFALNFTVAAVIIMALWKTKEE